MNIWESNFEYTRSRPSPHSFIQLEPNMAFLPPPPLRSLRSSRPAASSTSLNGRRTRMCAGPEASDEKPGIGKRLAQSARVIGTTGAAVAAVGLCSTIFNSGGSGPGTNFLVAGNPPMGVLTARAGGFASLSVSEKLSQVPVFARASCGNCASGSRSRASPCLSPRGSP